MAVSIKMPSAVVAVSPDPLGVVIEGDLLPIKFEVFHLLHRTEEPRHFSGVVVVVPPHDMNVPVKLIQIPRNGTRGAERKIPEMPDLIVRGDDRVPVGDDRAVHFLHIGERPLAVLDYFGVAKVRVGGEPSVHGAGVGIGAASIRQIFGGKMSRLYLPHGVRRPNHSAQITTIKMMVPTHPQPEGLEFDAIKSEHTQKGSLGSS